MRAVSEVGHLFSHFNSAKTSDRASRRCWASADATLRAHKPLSPIRHGRLGAVAPCRLGRVGFAWWRQSRQHTISRTRAAAAFPRVIGGPGSDFIPAAGASWPRACLAGGLQGFEPPPALPARACRASSATPSPAARGETGHPRDPSDDRNSSQGVGGARNTPSTKSGLSTPFCSGSAKRDRQSGTARLARRSPRPRA